LPHGSALGDIDDEPLTLTSPFVQMEVAATLDAALMEIASLLELFTATPQSVLRSLLEASEIPVSTGSVT
jgi:hypothetical protein